MNRLRFEKRDKAIYISHLDTMALFPRVFLRAGLHVKFTQGMSPHAYVSIALPLSVGMSSQCELLDFSLEGKGVELSSLPERLNPYFPVGIRVLEAYDSPAKVKELRYLFCEVTLEYDHGASEDIMKKIDALFQQREILVEKKTKKGLKEENIRPLIEKIAVERLSPLELRLNALICAQNPALNPQYLVKAMERYIPDCVPDFSWTHRVEVYDENFQIFR